MMALFGRVNRGVSKRVDTLLANRNDQTPIHKSIVDKLRRQSLFSIIFGDVLTGSKQQPYKSLDF